MPSLPAKTPLMGDFRSTRQIERHVVARGVSYFVGAVFYNTEALTNIAIVGFDPRLGAGVFINRGAYTRTRCGRLGRARLRTKRISRMLSAEVLGSLIASLNRQCSW